MKILLANDDGVYSPGLHALAKAFKAEGHQIRIVAPNSERSGAGHSMTMFAPIEVFEVVLHGMEDILCYAISGTPVDCVKLGVGNLFDWPDLVVTGINTGTNLGCDVYGSGTVNAAAAAVEKGLPAMAVSIGARFPKNLDVAANIAVKALNTLLPKLAGTGTLLSINVPDKPLEELKGVKVTPLARPNPNYPYDAYTSPRKRLWYWDSASPLNIYGEDEDVDNRWYREGYVTVTPIKFDIVNHAALDMLKSAEQKQTIDLLLEM